MKYPCAIAIDSQMNIIVCDSDNHRIQIFDSKGMLIRKFGQQGSGDGQFNYPSDVVIGESGNIVVADPDRLRLGRY